MQTQTIHLPRLSSGFTKIRHNLPVPVRMFTVNVSKTSLLVSTPNCFANSALGEITIALVSAIEGDVDINIIGWE